MASRNIFSLTDLNQLINKKAAPIMTKEEERVQLMAPLRSVHINPKHKYETSILESQLTFTSLKPPIICSMMTVKPSLHRLEQPSRILEQEMPISISINDPTDPLLHRNQTPKFRVKKMKTAKETKMVKEGAYYCEKERDNL